MSNAVFLEYVFLFDPNSTWQKLSEFELDLAQFFAAHGLNAESIKVLEGGELKETKRMLFIKKIEELEPLQPQNTSTTQEKRQVPIRFRMQQMQRQMQQKGQGNFQRDKYVQKKS